MSRVEALESRVDSDVVSDSSTATRKLDDDAAVSGEYGALVEPDGAYGETAGSGSTSSPRHDPDNEVDDGTYSPVIGGA